MGKSEISFELVGAKIGALAWRLVMIAAVNPRMCLILVMSAMLAVVFLCPANGYAQDSVSELERNVNASGRTYQGIGVRLTGEIGMGLVGEISAVVIGGGIFAGFGLWGGFFGGILASEIAVTPLTAGGVYLGGWLAGGRGKAGPVFGGSYIGAAVGWTLCGVGLGVGNDPLMYAGAITIPVLSLVGAVVGYELSERHETNRLKSELNKGAQGPMDRSRPIMINLFSGSF